ncbi:MAG: glycosyltransferase, partial [Erysipelotrichales bacterium]|nr:glycosyltransferase [Erysipelotrichales bacterium]
TLVSFYEKAEESKLDLVKYNIKNKLICNDSLRKFKARILREVLNCESRHNPFNRHCNIVNNYKLYRLLSALKELKNDGYMPNIIILEWTQVVLLVEEIKKIFPGSKIVASEHDVTFLGYLRKYQYEENIIAKINAKRKYYRIKKLELKALNNCDLIVTHNEKDMKLLLDNNISIDKQHVIVPYFMNMSSIVRNASSKDIIFFGAMNRAENYLSAIWFIENVFYKIKDEATRFIIIGGNPHRSLFNFANERVLITGFVEDVSPYFTNCLCFVAPLVLGAGIKVKVLEALSAGVPVLTNEIGIEGIPAINGEDYLHCYSADDYINYIDKIICNEIDTVRISKNSQQFIKDKFNLENSAQKYSLRLNSI